MIVYVVTEFFHSETEIQGVYASCDAAMKSIPDNYDKSTVEDNDEFKSGATVWTSGGNIGVDVARYELIGD